jgi:ABC-type nitrate/sulfonate/bicarbonate transport system substrate-binding protein
MALTPDAYARFFARADAALRAALDAAGLTATGTAPVVVTGPTGVPLALSPAEWDWYCCWEPADAVAELLQRLGSPPG